MKYIIISYIALGFVLSSAVGMFTTLNIWIGYITLGRGFDERLNYWCYDLDKEARDWGVDCKGKWGMFLMPR